MCCFSQPINDVSETNIFAKMDIAGIETVVYGMTLDTPAEVAMILPIPVKRDTGEDAVQFIDLSGYPTFFKDLDKGFPKPPPLPNRGGPVGKAPMAPPPPEELKVQKVGSFDASYVPTVADFSRLSKQFRLPPGTWEALPQYSNHGFAVFKLRKGRLEVHPMAFSFPSATPRTLFFPTVHIHDGLVHEEAEFDHALYCQRGTSIKSMSQWVESPGLAKSFVDVEKTKEIVLPENHVYRKKLRGVLKNTDTLVALA